jgi:hypothetical protein
MEMSERYNEAMEALTFGKNQLTAEDYADQKRKVEADMIAGIEESIRLGWMTQQEGDELLYQYMQRNCERNE